MADHIDSRAVLWASVRALMIREHGKENINQFHKRTGVPLGTLGRIKEQNTSVGLEVIDRIAGTFGLAGWQLLVPGFDPAAPRCCAPPRTARRSCTSGFSPLRASWLPPSPRHRPTPRKSHEVSDFQGVLGPAKPPAPPRGAFFCAELT